MLANIVTTGKNKPWDSSREPPIKIDYEVVAPEDELEGLGSSVIFQGSADKIKYDRSSNASANLTLT